MADGGPYAAVRAHPDGEATVARCCLTAAEYGYDGVVVRNHLGAPGEFDASDLGETYGVDVVEGVEIVAEDPSRASGHLGTQRGERPIVAVHGGTDAMNRYAVEQPAVDVLAHPTAGDSEPDQVLVRTAADNGVRLELALGALISDSGGSRVRAIRDRRRLWTMIDHYDAPYVVSTGATSHLELRAPRSLEALGETIGLGGSEVREGLCEWRRLANRNRDRLSAAFVEPGVWREDG